MEQHTNSRSRLLAGLELGLLGVQILVYFMGKGDMSLEAYLDEQIYSYTPTTSQFDIFIAGGFKIILVVLLAKWFKFRDGLIINVIYVLVIVIKTALFDFTTDMEVVIFVVFFALSILELVFLLMLTRGKPAAQSEERRSLLSSPTFGGYEAPTVSNMRAPETRSSVAINEADFVSADEFSDDQDADERSFDDGEMSQYFASAMSSPSNYASTLTSPSNYASALSSPMPVAYSGY